MRQSVKQLLRGQQNVTMGTSEFRESVRMETAEMPEGKLGAAWAQSPSGRRPTGPVRG